MTPLANLPGNLLTQNYYASAPYLFDRNRVDAKVNWIPTEKLTMFARFGFLRYNMGDPPIFGAKLESMFSTRPSEQVIPDGNFRRLTGRVRTIE